VIRTGLLALALSLAALSDWHGDAIRFVHPKRTLILGGLGGVDVPVQTLVARDPENRFFRLQWDGERCGGSSTKELDGENSPALQPIEPLKVRMGAGICSFAAAVYGPGGKLRALARLEVKVCGGEESCS
jgi:hypothetical protein